MQYNISYREKDKSIQYIISYKDNGKWKQKAKQGFRTKKEAKKAADEALEKLKKHIKSTDGIIAGLEGMTIGELKIDYLKHAKIHTSANTYKNYAQALAKFDIDTIVVVDLKVADVQKCINKLINIIQVSTIYSYLATLKSMLIFANNQYGIPITELKRLAIPKDKREKKNKALNENEVEKLLHIVKEKHNHFYIIALLAATTGMRVGEIMGLTWDDVDLKNGQIKVNKQWKLQKDGTFEFGALKSKNSNRIIPLPPSTVKELVAASKIKRLDNRLVKYNNTHTLTNNIDRMLRNKFGTSIHALRHTYATKLVASGLDFKTVAKILGHDVEQTIRTYSHVTDDMMDRATNVIQKIF